MDWGKWTASVLVGMSLLGCATSGKKTLRGLEADEALTTQPSPPVVPEEVALPEPQPGFEQEPPRSQSPNP